MSPRKFRLVAAFIAIAGMAKAEMSMCNFNFGVDFEQHSIKACGKVGCTGSISELGLSMAETDFMALPIGFTDKGAGQIPPSPYSGREGVHLGLCKSLMATPVWYSRIVAEGAKLSLGIEDCDSSGVGVCSQGAQYIRDNRAKIVNQYKAYATFAANSTTWGTNKPIVFVLEPGFLRYTSSKQKNALSFFEASQFLSEVAASIKAILPNAWISVDLPPTAGNTWWSQAIPLSQIKFLSTTGGESSPTETVKAGDSLAWSTAWGFSRKGMLADDGYQTKGVPDSNWLDENHLNARIADGVIGLVEAIGDTGWEHKVETIRPRLNQLKTCSMPTYATFTLKLQPGTGGSIQTNLFAQSKYDSATKFQFVATPQAGYRFVSWGGDVSGSNSPVSYVLDKNATISALFEPIPTKTFRLTVLPPSAGSISWTPNTTDIDSGAVVTLTATLPQGSTFANWTGFTSSTTNPFSFHMDSDKTVGMALKTSGILPRAEIASFAMRNTPSGLWMRWPAETGWLSVEIIGMDGATESVLQGTTVGQGLFEASYRLDGIRPGLHILRVINGNREFHKSITILR